MRELLEKSIGSHKRFTVGFLDENSYYDYHNLIISGIYEAAQKYNINIIRFSLFTGHAIAKDVSHENMFLESIRQFKLDGLICLGWARSLADKDIRDIYGDIPLYGLGFEHKEIPSAYFAHEDYIREALLHLIITHHYRNIAFIAPFWQDLRTDCYIETMKNFDIYDPQLFVDGSLVWGLDFRDRGVRAVQILLDERNIKPDAIVSLYSDEAYAIFTELKGRGVRIPEDIALTSFEDGETGKFSTPAITTVYFPWKELGSFAGESMYRQLMGEQVPLLSKIPGRLIYRGSCGCIPDSVKSSGSGELFAANKCFEELNEEELGGISKKIAEETAFSYTDVEVLLQEFRQAFIVRDNNPFLINMEMVSREIRQGGIYRETGTIASSLRRHLLPYFLPYYNKSTDKLVWAEDLFFQIQVMLQNKQANVYFKEDVKQKNIRLKLKEIGQILISNFAIENLMDSLEINLPKLKINSCFIYLFRKDGNVINMSENRLEFGYSGSKRIRLSDTHGVRINESLGKLMAEDRPYFLTAHLLHNGDEFAGIVLFEPANMEMGLYQSVAMQLSTALNGIILFEKLDSGYRRLMDQAHKKGMADISTGILHNIGNILNTINITTQSLTKLLEDNSINDLLMANELLKNRLDDLDDFIRKDPKGKILMQFYVSLKDSFADLRNKLQDNMGRLSERINLIDEIITAQQSYTGVKSNLKSHDLVTIINDVLKMHQTSFDRHGIQVLMNYGRSAKVLANRTKLFHVLTNIVKNAMEAMDTQPPDNRKLAIKVTTDRDKTFIRISDSGDGIAQEHLGDIFAYGFTTKMDGHGFGLHSCANYMTEMGGRLWAESAGTGMGATFVLQLKKPEGQADKSYED